MCVGPESAFWIVMSRLGSRRPDFGAGYRFQGPDRIDPKICALGYCRTDSFRFSVIARPIVP
jgi:hypothetical protein